MDAVTENSLSDRIHALLEQQDEEALRELLADTECFDLAVAFYHVPVAGQLRVLELMTTEDAADLLLELDASGLNSLLGALGPDRLAAYVQLMEPDDAADVVGMMTDENSRVVLEQLPTELRESIVTLLSYPPDTAGGLMDPDVVRVHDWQTVNEAMRTIRNYVDRVDLDEFFSVFVLDRQNKLVGVVPAWKMLLADPDELIRNVMVPEFVAVTPDTDQEHIAHLVRHHDLVTVPVVDEANRLLGRVTIDDVVDVIQEEYAEDLGRLSGTGAEEVRQQSVLQTVRLRAPWLLLALGGEFIAAAIMKSQEEFLRTLTQLAFFIPLIMAMAGNAGIQSSTLVIRGLATGELLVVHFWRRLVREILISLVIGVGLCVILVGSASLLVGNMNIGMAVGLATPTAILIASVVGTTMPMLLRRLGIDPALATGPFLTSMNDILGIAVYLSIAYAML